MLGLFNVLIGGVAFGSVLFLMAGGLSITFGLMGFANLAHAALAMVGGYTAVLLIGRAGWPFLLAIAAASATAAVVGVVLERGVFRFFYKRSELNQVLLTIGVVYVAIAAATFLIGPEQMAISVPSWLDGIVHLGPAQLNSYRLFLIGLGCVLFLALQGLINFTTFGAKIRAAAFNRRMAESCGIDVDRLYAIAFALGSALAGLGGALSVRLLGLDPNFAVKFLAELLIVVSVGGLGSIRGTFLAAMILGIVDMLGKYLLPEIGAFIVYAIAIAILTIRPQGLYGRIR
jgi:branched-chain amino acid transport system permease protein